MLQNQEMKFSRVEIQESCNLRWDNQCTEFKGNGYNKLLTIFNKEELKKKSTRKN